jgi:hypothetical protein
VTAEHGRVAASRHGQVSGVDGVDVAHAGAEGGGGLDLLLHDDVLVLLERATLLGPPILEPNFNLKIKS